MITLESPIQEIIEDLAENYFDPKKGHCNWGHDAPHMLRMLAARRAWWPAIVADEPAVEGKERVLDLAILHHDLNRSRDFRGKGEDAQKKRDAVARTIMSMHNIDARDIEEVLEIIAGTFGKDDPNEPTLVRLLRDFDKSDMGAVGIWRMAAVAVDRGYGIFARPSSFDLDAGAIEGDENLDSLADDIKFCHRWWDQGPDPKNFEIRTPVIRRIVEPRFSFMKDFLEQLRHEHKELGLI